MPPDIPKNRQAISRSCAVEVIERTQEDALRQLRRNGVPEAYALKVMARINALCLQTLQELDVFYLAFEELIGKRAGLKRGKIG